MRFDRRQQELEHGAALLRDGGLDDVQQSLRAVANCWRRRAFSSSNSAMRRHALVSSLLKNTSGWLTP